MEHSFTGRCIALALPLTAAVLLSQGCSDEQDTGSMSLAASADAGADNERPSRSQKNTAAGDKAPPSASASADAAGENSDKADTPSDDSNKGQDAQSQTANAKSDANEPDDPEETRTHVELDLTSSKLGNAGSFIDFDGDDQPDQLVGAPHAQYEGGLGAALVYAGSDQGWSKDPSATLVGDRDFGYAIADVGDVDGDGKREYAIAAPHGDSSDVSLSGSVSVFSGGSKGKLLAKLAGTVAASKYGLALAGGDFNGDGKADVVVGAPFHTPAADMYQTGAVFVHFGPRLDKSHALASSPSAKGLGWAVAAGDVNGDELDDLVISATSSAKVMVFFGKAEFAPALDKPDVVYTSKASGFGKTLAVLPDLSGDGHAEIAIGAPTAVVGTDRDVGSVVLAMAHGAAAPIDLDATPAPQQRFLQLDGPGLFSRFGNAIASAPDVDEDGLAELVIGAPLADHEPGDLVGRVYMFPSKRLGARDSSTAKAFAGKTQYGSFGSFIATDNAGHVLVGAPRSDADHGGASVIDLHAGQDTHFEPPISDADAGVEGEHDDHH